MKGERTHADEIRVHCLAQGCEWTPESLRRAYEAIVDTWTEAGFPPDKLVSQAPSVPGITKKWGSFKHKRKRLEATRFEGIETVSISHLAQPSKERPNPDDLYPDADWLVYAVMNSWWQGLHFDWIPALVGKPGLRFFDLQRELLTIAKAKYGYRYMQRYTDFALEFYRPETFPVQDLTRSKMEWYGPRSTRVNTWLLEDVFPHNYLSEAHLSAPFGETAMTLREWIEDDPAERGKLQTFTDILTEWAPPPKNVAKIREDLFRAGRLYYHRFFKELDYEHQLSSKGEIALRSDLPGRRDPSFIPPVYPPEPYYRADVFEAWEATGPIPEVYQAAHYYELHKVSAARFRYEMEVSV
jgi:hypothetical protein